MKLRARVLLGSQILSASYAIGKTEMFVVQRPILASTPLYSFSSLEVGLSTKVHWDHDFVSAALYPHVDPLSGFLASHDICDAYEEVWEEVRESVSQAPLRTAEARAKFLAGMPIGDLQLTTR